MSRDMRNIVRRLQSEERLKAARAAETAEHTARKERAYAATETVRLQMLTSSWLRAMLDAGSPGVQLLNQRKKSADTKVKLKQVAGWRVGGLEEHYSIYSHPEIRVDPIWMMVNGRFLRGAADGPAGAWPWELKYSDNLGIIPRLGALAAEHGVRWSAE